MPFLQDGFYAVDQVEYPRTGDLIVDPQALFAVAHQAGPAQHIQVLGDVRLALVQHGLDVADAALSLTQQLQDLQARGVGQGVEGIGL